MGRSFILPLIVAGTIFATGSRIKAFQLITPEEFSLPAGVIDKPRGNVPGPSVEAPMPPSDAIVKSPLQFVVRFKSYAGSKIDIDSIRVIYVKRPQIDLTARVKTHLQSGEFRPTGFTLDDAEVPPGQHLIRIQLQDTDGRDGAVNVLFQIGL